MRARFAANPLSACSRVFRRKGGPLTLRACRCHSENLNVKTLVVHSLGDTATSVAVMIVGILYYLNPTAVSIGVLHCSPRQQIVPAPSVHHRLILTIV